MVRCGLPFMSIQSLVDHCVARATLQQPKAYLTTLPPCWANACGGRVILEQAGSVDKVASPFKPLGLCAGPLPQHQVTFCFSPKSWGQVDVFP